MPAMSQALWRVANIYGLVSLLSMFAFMAFRDRDLLAKPSTKEKSALAAARSKFWNLLQSPLGLQHHFVTLRNGVKLHYVARNGTQSPKHLVIFFHGFPDSWLLWKRFLVSAALSNAVLIAVDLPGYGGSDSSPKYDPGHVLETMSAFVFRMREQYLSPDGTVLIVAHDWGAVIAARLASEAPQIADHFIITSAPIPRLFSSNIEARIASSRQMLHTWVRMPFSVRLLKRAFENISPVLGQIRRSSYIFVFNLPLPLADYFGRMGNIWFLRKLQKLKNRNPDTSPNSNSPTSDSEAAAEDMAVSAGPGLPELEDSVGGDGYPASVRLRVQDSGWHEKIRIYREGLLWSPWEKSLETIISLTELEEKKKQEGPGSAGTTGAGMFEDGPFGSLRAAATIVYGRKDAAFQLQLLLDGIGDFLIKGSQVVVLKEGGHWIPCEEAGWEVLERVSAWVLEDKDKGCSLKEELKGFEDVEVLLEK